MDEKLDNVKKSEVYEKWFDKLKDRMARLRIIARVKRLAEGNPGDVKHLTCGISELKIDYGPGYRVYYTVRKNVVYILLCGGNKTTQQQNIEKAKELLPHVEDFL